MRVAVDATSLLGVRTGVGNFTDAVVRGLARRDDLATTLFPVSLRGHRRLRELSPSGVEVVTPPLPARVLRAAWSRTNRPRIDPFIGRHDVVFGPNFVVPPSRAARVVTVHDLTAVRFPELCTVDTLRYPALLARAIDDGAWIHTVSDAVRAEVIEHLDAPPDRVWTIPNGFRRPGRGDADRGRSIAGHDSFVLAVGTIEPRKGLPTLIRAVDELAGAGHQIPLVHVGPDGWGRDDFDRAVASMARPDLITTLGARSDDDLDDLYAAARVFAYPSVYEGFGLPVLEAMSAGVPVVASDDPAVVEVSAGAAALAPIGDADALASVLARTWDDEDARSRLVELGRGRADDFTWERCVDQLVDLFRTASGDGDPR